MHQSFIACKNYSYWMTLVKSQKVLIFSVFEPLTEYWRGLMLIWSLVILGNLIVSVALDSLYPLPLCDANLWKTW